MKRFIITGLMVLCGVVFAQQASAESCYTEKQFEAERGLKLHTDIEVIMLTCRYSTHGDDLKKVYLKFLHQNAPAIRNWENVIAQAYAGSGGGRNEVIDNFRTKLANQKGNQAASMGPKPFCKEWSDFVPFAASLNEKQVMDYVRADDPDRPTRKPKCKS